EALRDRSWCEHMIIPGVQYPHCRPCSSQKPSCNGCSWPSLAIPSIVTTSEPSACTANIVHDFTARPFANTVQAPQILVSQPMCVPVKPAMSRMKCVSKSLGSTSFSYDCPFIVIFTCIRDAPWFYMQFVETGVLYANAVRAVYAPPRHCNAFRADFYTSSDSVPSVRASCARDSPHCHSGVELLRAPSAESRLTAHGSQAAERSFCAHRRLY